MLGMMLFGMNFGMLLQILWALEGFLANLAGMRLEWSMNSQMARDVVSFGAGRAAVFPSAGQAEVVGTLAADVVIAEVVVECFRVTIGECALGPKAFMHDGGIRVRRRLGDDRI